MNLRFVSITQHDGTRQNGPDEDKRDENAAQSITG